MRKTTNTGRYQPAIEPNTKELLDSVAVALRQKLPSSWSITQQQNAPNTPVKSLKSSTADAELVVRSPEGFQNTIIVDAKRRLDPKLVPVVVDQLRRYQQSFPGITGMVVAPFLSPRSRELLAQAQISYADYTGNMRLSIERPAIYVETSGASSDPWLKPGDRPLRSLKGPTAGRVVRALCDFRPPYGVQELAGRSGTSLASVSRVLSLLDVEALVVREPRGPVIDVKWADLIRRWAEDYSFSRSNRVRSLLEPRGLMALLSKLATTNLRYAVTGSLAANELAPIASPRLATIYVDSIDAVSEQLALRSAEVGANVLVAEPFDEVVFERGWERQSVRFAAVSQTAVDLLTGPGRGPAEGEELLRWMEDHQDEWRS